MRHLACSLVGYFGYILRNKKFNQFQSPLIWSPVTLGTGILPMPSSPYFVIQRPQTSFFSWLNLPGCGFDCYLVVDLIENAASLKFNLWARFSVDLNTWIGAYPIFRHPDFTLFLPIYPSKSAYVVGWIVFSCSTTQSIALATAGTLQRTFESTLCSRAVAIDQPLIVGLLPSKPCTQRRMSRK